MTETISLPGWQSWTPVKPNFLDKASRYYYSPYVQKNWIIKAGKKKTGKPISGWCSFYAFGRNINEEKILNNANILGHHIDTGMEKYVMVDDGWCRWGEWEKPDRRKFPKGMKILADNIKKTGCKPALWLAPFLTVKQVIHRLYVFPFCGLTEILDLEQIMVWIKIMVEEWGFEMLKLDFLYALYYLTDKKSGKEYDEILRSLLKRIKKKYPQVHLNVCGCPLGPAVGIADSVRISADIIIPYLQNLWPVNKAVHTLRLKQLEENLKGRMVSNKFFLLDPDVFVCRKNLGLSDNQILKLQALIKQANGVYFLGDDLTKLSTTEMEVYVRPLFERK